MKLGKKITAVALSGSILFSGLVVGSNACEKKCEKKKVSTAKWYNPWSWVTYDISDMSPEDLCKEIQIAQYEQAKSATRNNFIWYFSALGSTLGFVLTIIGNLGLQQKMQQYLDRQINQDKTSIKEMTSAEAVRGFRALLNSKFVGQDKLKRGYIDLISSFIEAKKQQIKPNVKNVLVQGKPATGKTAMAEEMAQYLGGAVVHVNLSLISDPRKTAINQLIVNADGTYTQLAYLFQSGNIENKVIILDELDKLSIERQKEVLEIFFRHSGSGTIAGMPTKNCIIVAIMNKPVDTFFADLNDTSWRSRFNRVVEAGDLDQHQYMQLIDLKLRPLINNWEREYNMSMNLSANAFETMAEVLMKDGHSARDIEGKFSQELSNDVINYVLNLQDNGFALPEKVTIEYNAREGQFYFVPVEKPLPVISGEVEQPVVEFA